MLYGQVLCNLIPAIIRVVLLGQTFRNSKKAFVFYCLSLALSQFLYRHLKKLGTPKRDSTGNLVSSGDDLNQPGMTEWMFDILYISCECIKWTWSNIQLILLRVYSSRSLHLWGMVLVDISCGISNPSLCGHYL